MTRFKMGVDSSQDERSTLLPIRPAMPRDGSPFNVEDVSPLLPQTSTVDDLIAIHADERLS